MTVEQAVHRMTGQLADVFGFVGRGVLAEGKVGDVTIFSLDELDWQTDVFVDDLPLGAARLRRPPGGFRQTIVAGTVVQEAGNLTGARPGVVLRAGSRS
jgi:N-acyl-D-aspartate/D-glutamate deacylase